MTLTAPDPTVEGAARVAVPRTWLMCRPEHFTVEYRINPWMHPEHPTDTSRALAQWQRLHDLYVELGHDVRLIDPEPGLPDMVYAANGGFTIDGIAYAPRFAHPERAGEAPAYSRWFADNGFRLVEAAETNEGEGDFLLVGDTILAGTGFRSSNSSHEEVGRVFDREVVSLELVDPRFYHLDTALAVLDPVTPAVGAPNIAYLPGAFDDRSRAELERRYPDAVLVSDEDAVWLGLNCISDGYNVVIAERATGFEASLRERGYNPIGVDLSELLLGGGGVKCCTLELRY
ncbi:dimethylargininase [Naasia sp. SYSU D00057]|uniref:dimethylargininase n=1 Tax=Naasia sp. SYSU D00057 TaxID=2817380 RepID=UPI001B300DAB|nr:dimethylargininase [Naasia sp. SYSU D00057]